MTFDDSRIPLTRLPGAAEPDCYADDPRDPRRLFDVEFGHGRLRVHDRADTLFLALAERQLSKSIAASVSPLVTARWCLLAIRPGESWWASLKVPLEGGVGSTHSHG